jgi:hypothetical protein
VRILYRIHQFWQALRASLTEKELAKVREVLNQPPLLALFLRLQPSEQAHSFQVLKQLQSQGPCPPDLLIAALLHDVGKICLPLQLWERILIVLGRKLLPRLARRWGQDERHGWRPFVVAEQHARWGAELARQAGASPLTVALIRRHQDPIPQPAYRHQFEDGLLHRLQSVDNES